MTIKDLKQSCVIFDEAAHTYRRGDEQLSGITPLIRSVLLLGVYHDANDYAKDVAIPRAGYYGKCVHQAIQVWEDMGVEMTQFPELPHPTADFLPAQDVAAELGVYKRLKPADMETVASEMLVDLGSFATSIDAVWCNAKGLIYLVDHKTNNLEYYPGGADALKEYLSWQLSCEAVMFEHQTGLKVAGLMADWIRKESGELWKIERKADDQVMKLLSTDVLTTPDGFAYLNAEMQVIAPEVTEVAVATEKDLAVPVDVLDAITALLKAEKAAKKMKEQLRELMEIAGYFKFECEQFAATIGKPSESTTFDAKAFQKDHPDLYDQYLKATTRKGSLTFKLK